MVVYLVSREHVPVFESPGRASSPEADVRVLLDRRLPEHDRETRRPFLRHT